MQDTILTSIQPRQQKQISKTTQDYIHCLLSHVDQANIEKNKTLQKNYSYEH